MSESDLNLTFNVDPRTERVNNLSNEYTGIQKKQKEQTKTDIYEDFKLMVYTEIFRRCKH